MTLGEYLDREVQIAADRQVKETVERLRAGLEASVTEEVTERVTEEVTERVTEEVTERVTEEVTERVTEEVKRDIVKSALVSGRTPAEIAEFMGVSLADIMAISNIE